MFSLKQVHSLRLPRKSCSSDRSGTMRDAISGAHGVPYIVRSDKFRPL